MENTLYTTQTDSSKKENPSWRKNLREDATAKKWKVRSWLKNLLYPIFWTQTVYRKVEPLVYSLAALWSSVLKDLLIFSELYFSSGCRF